MLSKFLIIIIFNGGGGGGIIIKFADFIKTLIFLDIIIKFLKEVNPTFIISNVRIINIKNDLIREFFINFKTKGVN